MSKSPYQIIEESRRKEAERKEMLADAASSRKPDIWDIKDDDIWRMTNEELKEYLLLHLNRFDLHKEAYVEIVKAVRSDLIYMRG